MLICEEVAHLFLHLSGLLDKKLLFFGDLVIGLSSLLNDVSLERSELLLKEFNPPFSDDDEVVEELIFADIEFVVCVLLMAIKDLNKRCGEVSVLNLVNGLDGVVVEVDHDVPVVVELLEHLHFVLIKLPVDGTVFVLKGALQLLKEKRLGDLEEAGLGTNNLFIVELVVVCDGFLVLKPFVGLAVLKLSAGTDNNTLEFLELLKDLLFDLIVVVVPLVSVELLGEI